jgi:phage terminase large subunit-like protein
MTYRGICDRYADQIIDGTIPSGKPMILAAKRWKRDIEEGKFYFIEEKAALMIDWVESRCCHWEGSEAGKLIKLEPWQIFYFANLYGWYREPEAEFRRFRTTYLQVARKNGKTFMAAVMALYMISPEEGEPSPQVLAAANTEAQAGLCVNSAGSIVRLSPELSVDQTRNKFIDAEDRNEYGLHALRERYIKVVNNRSNGLLQTLGRDASRLDGYNPSAAIVDEYHEAKTSGMFHVLRSGMGSRKSPGLHVITTAGFNKHGVCYNLRSQYMKMLEEIVPQESVFAMIFEMDADDNWQDHKTWMKCNPNLGVSVYEGWLEEEAHEAAHQGGTAEVAFKTKNLNMWTDSESVWIADEDVVAASMYSFDIKDWKGKKVWAGIDLAKNRDLNSLALIHQNLDTGKMEVFWKFYLPEDRAKENRDGVDYMTWAAEGWLDLTPGNIIDHNYIVRDVEKILDMGVDIKAIGYDRYLAESHNTVHGILELGYAEMRDIPQSPAYLSTPTKEIEVRVMKKTMCFTNPIARWMFSNVVIKVDQNGNVKADKEKSGNKIDGISALVNAMNVYMADNIIEEVTIDNQIYNF